MKKILFFILYILISLFHAKTYATNGHETAITDTVNLSNLTDEQYESYFDSIKSKLYPQPILVSADSSKITQESPIETYSLYDDEIIISSVSLDYTKDVGQIPIKSDVTSTGAKTYEIPIDVYPGIKELNPKLSLYYNSQQGNNILGVGWSLSGIQAITRGVKTKLMDGDTGGVKQKPDDAFYLNGIRLVKLSETDENIIYESEKGNIKVKAYISGNITKYFEVFYPNGNKGIFGKSSNTSTNYHSYPLMSLYDLFQNSIEYIYNYFDNHYSLRRIEYNNATVEFQYITRTDTLNYYSGGYNIIETKLLSSIISKFENKTLGTYTLSYTTNNYLSLLSQVDYDCNSRTFNPIRFFYKKNHENEPFSKRNVQLFEWYRFNSSSTIRTVRGKFDYISGDDGLIVFPNNNPYWKYYQHSTWFRDTKNYFKNLYENNQKIIVYTNLSGFTTVTQGIMTTGNGFIDVLCADLEGKQDEYIIKINNTVTNSKDRVTFKVYRASIMSGLVNMYSRDYDFSTVYKDESDNQSIQPKFYYSGDFNGDGKSEILAVSVHEPFGDTTKPSICYLFDLANNRILHQEHVFDFNFEFVGTSQTDPQAATNNSDKLLVLDVDGDGKSDICHIDKDGIHVYTFNLSGSSLVAEKMYSFPYLNKQILRYKEVLLGDMNGDGLGDLVVTPSCYNSGDNSWWICNSTGAGFSTVHDFESAYNSTDTNIGFMLQDVNTDGISDIIKFQRNSANVYFAKNNTANSDNIQIILSHYNNTAKLIPLNVTSRNTYTQLLALNDSIITRISHNRHYADETLIRGMANSLGVVESNTYQKIDAESVESGFYTKGIDAVFPYVNIQEPLSIVSSVETFVNGSFFEKLDYSYTNAVIHRQGLGFCGFGEIKCTDSRAKTRTQIFDPYKYGVMTKEITDEYEHIFSYSSLRRSNGTLRLHLGSKTEKDLLKGTQTVTLIEYDDYESPKSIAVYYPNGITTNTNNYYSNNTNVGDGYYIGFLNEKTVVTHRTGTESITERMFIPAHSSMQPSIKQYFINGNLIENNVYQYDEYGNLTSHRVTPYESTVSQVINYNYDSYGRLIKKTDPMGLSNEYVFDDKGRVSVTKDKRGNATTHAYDSFGRDTLTVYPDNTKKAIKYAWSTDRNGELYTITTSETGKPTEIVYYDALNRETRRGTVRFDGSMIYVDKVYNSIGKLKKESLPYKTGSASLWNIYTYDSHDRVTAYTEASGRTTAYSYNGTKITTVEDGVSITRDYDALGNIITVEDAAGIISYNLCADGKPASISVPGNVTTTFGYDRYRRRISLNDPSHGITTYEYNAAGNIYKVTNARGDSTIYSYDNFNRLVYAVMPEMVVSYIYNEYNEPIESITEYMSGTSLQSYSYTDYDNYGRISTYSETLDNKTFRKDFEYSDGNVSCVKYYYKSSLLAKENHEYINGHLERIKIDDFTRYKLSAENEFGQPTQISSYRNTRYYNYDSYGLPIGRKVKNAHGDTIQNETYSFDIATRNLLSRSDRIHNTVETFSYDNLNRLVGDSFGDIQYDIKGNILFKSGVGSMEYNLPSKPYAVTNVENVGESIPRYTQSVSYTSFHRPNVISENGIEARIQYDGNGDRHRMYVKRNGNTILTRHYFSDCYERDVDSLSNVTQRLYLGGSTYDATMMLEIDSTGSELHYLFRDYLGNVRLVTDRFGDVVQELSYDAWGRLRNPATHEVYAPGEEPELKIGRGYTGHEHLPWFGLINMNARLYDPVLGRFLSPDPFVQAPDLSQSFNRYTYAMNNPFRYTDESGEFWWLVIGAVIGGATNVIMKAVSEQLHSWGDGFAAFGIGAAAGMVGGAVSGWAFGVAGGAAAGAGGFYAGSLSGAAGSAISAPILSGGNSLYFGDPFMSASEYAYGVLGGALVGGTINGITASVNGKNFFTGRGKNSVEDIIAGYKDSFSLNEHHNTTNYSAHDSHNGINTSSTNNITNNNYTRFIANEDGSIIDMKPTIDRVSKGETISRFKNDGTIFRNEELLLPKINTNYTEWVVPTPGLPLHRAGPMRIVFGGEKYWFTNDHYKSFILLNP
ncbi:MAG: endonuclease [Muribaculaceae bacterium]|nr:endonuclease [Muribaculaceae bacterium]